MKVKSSQFQDNAEWWSPKKVEHMTSKWKHLMGEIFMCFLSLSHVKLVCMFCENIKFSSEGEIHTPAFTNTLWQEDKKNPIFFRSLLSVPFALWQNWNRQNVAFVMYIYLYIVHNIHEIFTFCKDKLPLRAIAMQSNFVVAVCFQHTQIDS